MTSDDAIRAAERSGDRAALVLALVRAGRGQEAVARCGLHVGDVVRRAREPWPLDFAGRRAREGAAFGALLRITGAHAFSFNDPDAADGATTTWLEGGDPAAQGPKGCDGPVVLARTLDLVEPGDGECVLAPQLRTDTV